MACDDVTADDLKRVRGLGEQAAHETAPGTPTDPLARIAWEIGFGRVDRIQAAIDAARAEGITWKSIALATGEHFETTRTKWGGGRQRMREYQRRQRGSAS